MIKYKGKVKQHFNIITAQPGRGGKFMADIIFRETTLTDEQIKTLTREVNRNFNFGDDVAFSIENCDDYYSIALYFKHHYIATLLFNERDFITKNIMSSKVWGWLEQAQNWIDFINEVFIDECKTTV